MEGCVIPRVNYLNTKAGIPFHVAVRLICVFAVCLLFMRQNICATSPLPVFGEFLNDLFIQHLFLLRLLALGTRVIAGNSSHKDMFLLSVYVLVRKIGLHKIIVLFRI